MMMMMMKLVEYNLYFCVLVRLRKRMVSNCKAMEKSFLSGPAVWNLSFAKAH